MKFERERGRFAADTCGAVLRVFRSKLRRRWMDTLTGLLWWIRRIGVVVWGVSAREVLCKHACLSPVLRLSDPRTPNTCGAVLTEKGSKLRRRYY
jgi:hypothetical protein